MGTRGAKFPHFQPQTSIQHNSSSHWESATAYVMSFKPIPPPPTVLHFYRTLFHQLDGEGVWVRELSEESLERARSAAATENTWTRFIRGSACSHGDTIHALRKLSTSARSGSDDDGGDVEMEVAEHDTGAVVRRRLTLAAIDAATLAQYAHVRRSETYEPDAGLMAGDGGASFESLHSEEAARRLARAPVFSLLGPAPHEESQTRSPRKRPRRPTPAARFVALIRAAIPAAVSLLQDVERRAHDGYYATTTDCAQDVECVIADAPIHGTLLPTDVHQVIAQCAAREAAIEALHACCRGVLAPPARRSSFEGAGIGSDDAARAVDEIVGSALVEVPQESEVESGDDGDEYKLWRSQPDPVESEFTDSIDEQLLPVFKDNAPPVEHVAIESFASLLGEENAVLKSVMSTRRILALRKAAIAARDKNSVRPTPVKAEPTEIVGAAARPTPLLPSVQAAAFVIENEPTCRIDATARYTAIARAATALMLEQAGFTHTSTRALDVLTDAAAQLVHRLGKRLNSARERVGEIDVAEAPEPAEALIEAARVVTARGGVRGGAAALDSYANYETRRLAVEQQSAEHRLSALCTHYGADTEKVLAKLEPKQSEHQHGDSFSTLNDASWTFGYLPRGAAINVLGATPTPPRTLGCAVLRCSDPAEDAPEAASMDTSM